MTAGVQSNHMGYIYKFKRLNYIYDSLQNKRPLGLIARPVEVGSNMAQNISSSQRKLYLVIMCPQFA